jgi:hypothetical protein
MQFTTSATTKLTKHVAGSSLITFSDSGSAKAIRHASANSHITVVSNVTGATRVQKSAGTSSITFGAGCLVDGLKASIPDEIYCFDPGAIDP